VKKHPGSANSGIFGQKHRHNPSQEMTHVKNRPRFRKGRGLEKKNAESILLSTNGDSATIFFIFFLFCLFYVQSVHLPVFRPTHWLDETPG